MVFYTSKSNIISKFNIIQKSISKYQNIIFQNSLYFETNYFILNHKMKLLYLIIKLLNFQNFNLSKFIRSLKLIKTMKIQLSQHLENATESHI